ncbi:MAG: methyltransferase domain-containing protein [Gemmataceae bacterium]
MDQPGLDPRAHTRALSGLSRLNLWSNSVGILWPAIRDLSRRVNRRLRVLDVATGGGDIPIRLWQKAQRSGVGLDIAGCDLSPVALEHARTRASQLGAEVTFFQHDIIRSQIPDGYDIVVSSLFLHHLDELQAVALLKQASQSATHLVLINDLRRSLMGLLLAVLASRFLTFSSVVRVDAPLSVRAAFTLPEAKELADKAGLMNAQVVPKWPFRFLLSWEKRQGTASGARSN